MATPKTLVNLDAMIVRADFAQSNDSDNSYETIDRLPIRDLTSEGLTGKILRKPDFQRETNHWTPEQIISLLECFINGDLIPSVILWKSPTYFFVIDGGHRLSVLKAWAEDDYGDGPISRKYFGNSIPNSQLRAAERTRKLINDSVGTYQHIKSKIENGDIDTKVTSVLTRALPVQWVKGDAGKAEASFFKINTQGTPLDDIEQSLLENRSRPIAISARAIIRAGKGHKYWSKFSQENTTTIETISKKLHSVLFEPEATSPIKTLDLPLGGSNGIRTALQILIDFLSIACITQAQKNNDITYGDVDETGDLTIRVLKRAQTLADRISGNDGGSLGLHPAIYFYGPSGVHSSPLFLGTSKFISNQISNNNGNFFKQFSERRAVIEQCLINNKDLIATIIQKYGSKKRIDGYCNLIGKIFEAAKMQSSITESSIVEWAGLKGKIVFGGGNNNTSSNFSTSTKSSVFINATITCQPKCPICSGYIDSAKSMSYDHIKGKAVGGIGSVNNLQLTHPVCNQNKN